MPNGREDHLWRNPPDKNLLKLQKLITRRDELNNEIFVLTREWTGGASEEEWYREKNEQRVAKIREELEIVNAEIKKLEEI